MGGGGTSPLHTRTVPSSPDDTKSSTNPGKTLMLIYHTHCQTTPTTGHTHKPVYICFVTMELHQTLSRMDVPLTNRTKGNNEHKLINHKLQVNN